MSVEQNPIESMNLATYDLRVLQAPQPKEDPRGLYALANGLIFRMTQAMGYEDLGKAPSEAALRGWVNYSGPEKELQHNIERVQERLGNSEDIVEMTAGWAIESGAMLSVNRSFVRPDLATPKHINNTFIQSGVGRWMIRKAHGLGQGIINGEIEISDENYLLGGTRPVGDGEHDAVKDMSRDLGRQPTEAEFQEKYTKPMLKNVYGVDVVVADFNTRVGDEIMSEFVRQSNLLGGTVLALANAPSSIQSAGQFRIAARNHDSKFDANGQQLYMRGDTIELALKGEPAATHQNTKTAATQIARDYLILELQPR